MTFRKHILTKDYRTSAAASEFAYHKLKQIKYPCAVICSLSWDHSLAASSVLGVGCRHCRPWLWPGGQSFRWHKLPQPPQHQALLMSYWQLMGASCRSPPPAKFLSSIGDVQGQKHGSKEWQIPNRIFLSPHSCLGPAPIHFLSSYTEA